MAKAAVPFKLNDRHIPGNTKLMSSANNASAHQSFEFIREQRIESLNLAIEHYRHRITGFAEFYSVPLLGKVEFIEARAKNSIKIDL